MRIACGFDHAAFELREKVFATLREGGHEVLDLGVHANEPVDYPDIALAVARALTTRAADRGVLVCGSGAGVSVAANKVPGIRASVVHDAYTAHQAVEHDDLNVICLGARVIGAEVAAEILRAFASAAFSGEERHRRRLEKIEAIERDAAERG